MPQLQAQAFPLKTPAKSGLKGFYFIHLNMATNGRMFFKIIVVSIVA